MLMRERGRDVGVVKDHMWNLSMGTRVVRAQSDSAVFYGVCLK